MARFYYHGTELRISTGESIGLDDWNARKERAKDQIRNSAVINDNLDKLEQRILSIYNSALQEGIPINNEYLKKCLKLGRSTSDFTFFEAYERFIDLNKEEMSTSRIKAYKSCKAHLETFQEVQRIPLTLNGFTPYIFDDFKTYLIKERLDREGKVIKEKMLNNTVEKYLKIVKRFMKWGFERSLHRNESFKMFENIRKDETDVIHLTEEELETLRKHHFENPAQDHERDMYLIRCYTGIRYSDLENLKPVNVCSDHLTITTVKTRDALIVPLVPQAKAIIDKYLDRPSFLNLRSLQKSNESLKAIMMAAGINSPIQKVRFSGAKRIETNYKKWQLLTTHTARKTFVTLSRKRGIPDDLIMKITGIKDHKTLQKYKHIDSDQIMEAMKKAWG